MARRARRTAAGADQAPAGRGARGHAAGTHRRFSRRRARAGALRYRNRAQPRRPRRADARIRYRFSHRFLEQARAMTSGKLLKPHRVDHPDKFSLADCDPADTGGVAHDKKGGKAMLAKDVERLGELQERLYAHGRWAVLVVLQGMDAAGKDGVISHVMSAVNPQGCTVHPFKAPSDEELSHDFLWRAAQRLPARGQIGIFNRSYYEETLVVRVHPEMLLRQKIPEPLAGKDIWKNRFHDIRAFERHLARSGVLVLKFFLHISREEQRQRLLARIDDPAK